MKYIRLMEVDYTVKSNKTKLIVLVVLTFVICFFIHNSIKTSDFDAMFQNKELNYMVSIPRGLSSKQDGIINVDAEQYESNINDFQELLDGSDIVVIANLDSRIQQGRTVNSTVVVEKVLKGTINEKKIKVFEPYHIRESDEVILPNDNAYLPMKYETSYVLFLRKIDLYEEENQFNLVSDFYGKFPNKEKLILKEVVSDQDYLYEDLKGIDLLLVSSDQARKDINSDELSSEEYERKLDQIKKYEEYRDMKYQKMFHEVLVFKNRDNKLAEE